MTQEISQEPQETKSFTSICQEVKEQLDTLSSGLGGMPSVCSQQIFHVLHWETGYAEDKNGRPRPELDKNTFACLKPNYVQPKPSLLEEEGYRKAQEILMGMKKCLEIASQDPYDSLRRHRHYLKENLRFCEGNLKPNATILEACAFLEANAPSRDRSYLQDMERFRLVLLKRVSSAMPALRESLLDIRIRMVKNGEIPTFDYYNPNHRDPTTGKKGRKETFRNIYPEFSPAEDRLMEMIKSTRTLGKTLNGMIEGFWGSVGDSPKGDSPDNRLSNIISLDAKRGPSGQSRG